VLETQVSTITGLKTYISNRFSRLLILIGIVLTIGGIATITSVGVIFLVVGLAMVAIAFSRFGRRGTVTIQVYSQQVTPSPVTFGNAWADAQGGIFRSLVRVVSGPIGFLTSLFGAQDAFDFLLGLPGPDALKAAAELGAMVNDLKSKGSLAETHWQE